jgi:hypothetical protein
MSNYDSPPSASPLLKKLVTGREMSSDKYSLGKNGWHKMVQKSSHAKVCLAGKCGKSQTMGQLSN